MDPKPAPAPLLAAPRLVGRYALVSKIGSGALGELFRARIASGRDEGKPALLRLVERGAAIDARSVERITNAGFAAMKLDHPKTAAVLDVAVGDSEIAIASEHVGGALLSSLLKQPGPKRVPATTPIALRIVADVLEALDAVRAPWSEITADPSTDDERAIATGLHGGLMPDDLVVATSGETVLLEPGLAGAAMTLPVIADHPDVIAYRAPEQLERGGAAIDERTDVFTIGVLAWELVAGRSLFGPMFVPKPSTAATPGKPKPPSDQAQVSATRRKVLTAPIQRLDAMPLLKGKVTKEAASWVARCLERDPSARFSSLQEATTELRALGASAIAGADAVAKWIGGLGIELELPPPGSPSKETPSPEKASVKVAAEAPKEPPSFDTATVKVAVEAPKEPPSFDTATVKVAVEAPKETPSFDTATVQVPLDALMAAAGLDTTTVKVAASQETAPPESVPPSTDIESIPPSAEIASSAGTSIPPSTDIESIPPSIPPSGDIESIPPSSEDAATLPPPPRPDIAPVAAALSAQIKVAAFPVVASKLDVAPSSGEEATSAPVVRPLPGAARAEDLFDEPVQSTRPRKDSRKVVLYVMAGAGLLAFLGIVHALTSHTGESASEKTAASATPAAASTSGNAPPASRPVAPAVPPGSPAREAVPTSSPTSPAAPEHAPTDVPAVKRAPPRKRYRPTGI